MRDTARGAVVASIVGSLILAAATGSGAQSPADNGLGAAEAAFEEGRLAEARMSFAAAVRADPADARSRMFLGRIAMREGRVEEATKLLEEAVRRDPRSAEVQHWLGRAYAQEAMRAGMLRRASLARRIRGALERAVALDPDLVEARADLLQFHLVAPSVMGGSVSRARAEQREIAARDPSRGRVAAALLAERDGDRARAERELIAAIREFPDSAAAYYVLGSMYQRSERALQAIELYEKLLARRPDETLALYQIGRAASISGERLETGASSLLSYLRSPQREGTPLRPAAHYRLGLVHERSGDAARARGEFEAVLRLDPRHSDAKAALARVSGN